MSERNKAMLLDKNIIIPDLGPVGPESGFHLLETTEDGKFVSGKNGVDCIVATGDKKVEFVSYLIVLQITMCFTKWGTKVRFFLQVNKYF